MVLPYPPDPLQNPSYTPDLLGKQWDPLPSFQINVASTTFSSTASLGEKVCLFYTPSDDNKYWWLSVTLTNKSVSCRPNPFTTLTSKNPIPSVDHFDVNLIVSLFKQLRNFHSFSSSSVSMIHISSINLPKYVALPQPPVTTGFPVYPLKVKHTLEPPLNLKVLLVSTNFAKSTTSSWSDPVYSFPCDPRIWLSASLI